MGASHHALHRREGNPDKPSIYLFRQCLRIQDAYYDDETAMANAAARDKKSAGPDKSAQNLGALFDHYAGASLSVCTGLDWPRRTAGNRH